MSTTVTAPPRPTPMPTPAHYYPVHVWADAQPDASRWLWLVKWLLLIPHLRRAGVALDRVRGDQRGRLRRDPGHRPLPARDVRLQRRRLRWSWRVAYYGYGALGTDRYPPFTLADVPDYPAHLEVDYPEHLSRGLVLVKWWLLALPHYLVVGILVGGGGSWCVANDDSAAGRAWAAAWSALLVLVGARRAAGHRALPAVALRPGPGPEPVGAEGHRLRRADDRRLSAVPPRPGAERAGRRPGPPEQRVGPGSPVDPRGRDRQVVAPSATASGAGWTAGRVVSVVAGSVLGLTALGMVTGGVALLVADTAMRDGSGYLSSAERQVSSSGYAVVAPSMRIHTSRGASMVPRRMMGDVRLRATAPAQGRCSSASPPSSDVDRYLGDVARTVPDSDWAGGREDHRDRTRRPADGPGRSGMRPWWAPAPRSSAGLRRSGDWAVVLMNADGCRRRQCPGECRRSAALDGQARRWRAVRWRDHPGRLRPAGRRSRSTGEPTDIAISPGSAPPPTPVPTATRQEAPMTSSTQPTTYEIESVTLHEQPALVVRKTVTQSGARRLHRRCVTRVSDVARSDGIPVWAAVRALARRPDGTFTVEAGFPVAGMVLRTGRRQGHAPPRWAGAADHPPRQLRRGTERPRGLAGARSRARPRTRR